MSFANNIENKNELLGGKKLKVKYIPGGNFMQMSASEESCEDTCWPLFTIDKSRDSHWQCRNFLSGNSNSIQEF